MMVHDSKGFPAILWMLGCLIIAIPAHGSFASEPVPAEEAPVAAQDAPPVKVHIQFVQLDHEREAATPNDVGQNVNSHHKQQQAQEESDEQTYEMAVRETTGWMDDGLRVQSASKTGYLEYAGIRIPLKDGVVQAPRGSDASGSVRVLMAPSIEVTPGRPAAITVGEHVAYMEKQDDGSLVVKHSDSMLEGIEIKVTVDEATSTLVSFREMSFKISKVVGRQPIPGVPFDVGRPIVRSAALATALRMGYEHVVAVSVPQLADDQTQIVVLLSVETSE